VGQLAAPVYLLDLIGVAPGERHRASARLLCLEGFRLRPKRGARSLVLWRDDAPGWRAAHTSARAGAWLERLARPHRLLARRGS
jgi:hypothetical protein